MAAANSENTSACLKDVHEPPIHREFNESPSPVTAFLLWREWHLLQAIPVNLPLLPTAAKSLRLRKLPITLNNSDQAVPCLCSTSRTAQPPIPGILEVPTFPLGSRVEACDLLFVLRSHFDDVSCIMPGDRVFVCSETTHIPKIVQNIPFRIRGECLWIIGNDKSRAAQSIEVGTNKKWLLRLSVKHEQGQRLAQLSRPCLEVVDTPRVAIALLEQSCELSGLCHPTFGSERHLSLLARVILAWLLSRTAPGVAGIIVTLAMLERAFPSIALLRRSASINLMRSVATLVVDPLRTIQIDFNPGDSSNPPQLSCKISLTGASILIASLMKYERLVDLHRCESPFLRLAGLVESCSAEHGSHDLTPPLVIADVYRTLRKFLHISKLVVPMRSTVSSLIKLFAAYRWGEEAAETLPLRCVSNFGLVLMLEGLADVSGAIASIVHHRKGSEREEACRTMYGAANKLLQRLQHAVLHAPLSRDAHLRAALEPVREAPTNQLIDDDAATDALLDEFFGPQSDNEAASGRNSAVGDETYLSRMPKKLTIYNHVSGFAETVTDRLRIAELWDGMRGQARQGAVPKCGQCNGPLHLPGHCFTPLREGIAFRAFVNNLPGVVGSIESAMEKGRPRTPSIHVLEDTITLGAVSMRPADPEQRAALAEADAAEREERLMMNAMKISSARREAIPLASLWEDVVKAAKQDEAFSRRDTSLKYEQLPKKWDSLLIASETDEQFVKNLERIFTCVGDPRRAAFDRALLERRADISSSVAANSSRSQKRQRLQESTVSFGRATASPIPRSRPATQSLNNPLREQAAPSSSFDANSLISVQVHRPSWTCQFCHEVLTGDQFSHLQECSSVPAS